MLVLRAVSTVDSQGISHTELGGSDAGIGGTTFARDCEASLRRHSQVRAFMGVIFTVSSTVFR